MLGRPGATCAASIALSSLALVLLIYAAFHVEVDRTNRRPVVTWLGPAAAWGDHLGIIVTWLIVPALILAMPAIARDDRERFWGMLAIFLSSLTMFGGLMFFTILFED